MLLPERIGEFAAYLAQGGQLEQAFALTETLLASFSERETSFDVGRYVELLIKLFPVLVSHGNRGALEFLCSQLSSTLASSDDQNNSKRSFSYRWRPAIESHEQNNVRGPHEVENLLVSSVRNARGQFQLCL